jgi:hypothetical protein
VLFNFSFVVSRYNYSPSPCGTALAARRLTMHCDRVQEHCILSIYFAMLQKSILRKRKAPRRRLYNSIMNSPQTKNRDSVAKKQ